MKGNLEFTDSQLGLIAQDPQDTGSINDATFFTRNPDTGQALGMRTPDGPYYFISDRLGSVTALADSGGSVVRRYRYEPLRSGSRLRASPRSASTTPTRRRTSGS